MGFSFFPNLKLQILFKISIFAIPIRQKSIDESLANIQLRRYNYDYHTSKRRRSDRKSA